MPFLQSSPCWGFWQEHSTARQSPVLTRVDTCCLGYQFLLNELSQTSEVYKSKHLQCPVFSEGQESGSHSGLEFLMGWQRVHCGRRDISRSRSRAVGQGSPRVSAPLPPCPHSMAAGFPRASGPRRRIHEREHTRQSHRPSYPNPRYNSVTSPAATGKRQPHSSVR